MPASSFGVYHLWCDAGSAFPADDRCMTGRASGPTTPDVAADASVLRAGNHPQARAGAPVIAGCRRDRARRPDGRRHPGQCAGNSPRRGVLQHGRYHRTRGNQLPDRAHGAGPVRSVLRAADHGGCSGALRPAEDLPARPRDQRAADPTEQRVLKLLPTSTCPQIAASLYVAQCTVKTHLRAIYQKLGVASRSEALERALDLGLL